MKLKLILSAALVAGVISASAATSGTSPAMATPPLKNSAAADPMTTLFGDPVIAKGKGFEVKRSDLDQVVTSARANYTAGNQPVPADFDAGILNQLITIQMLLQKATPSERAAG